MSDRERIKCSVCHEEVENEGQELMSHKCFKEQIEREKPSSSNQSDSINSSEKCSVFKCPLCKKDVMKVGSKLMRHKCQMLLRPNADAKIEERSRSRTSGKLFRCSLCNKKLKRVGQRCLSHKCSFLGSVGIPKLGKGQGEAPVALVFRTYVRCHLCKQLVEKVGPDTMTHKCSQPADSQSLDYLENPTSTHTNSKESRVGSDANLSQSTQVISCHLPVEEAQTNILLTTLTPLTSCIGSNTGTSNEHADVDSWVKEHIDRGVVRFYKPVGSFLPSHPDLSENDLIITILSDAQCEVLKQYSSDCICVDVIDGIKKDFELVTLMVLNELGQGLPCCFMLTNRIDSRRAEILFDVVKTVVGSSVVTSILMTDASTVFWNAWNVVMQSVPPTWLYSTWQVEAAWSKNLPLVRSNDKRTTVQETLKTVLQEQDESTFTKLLGSALEVWGLDLGTVDFSNYFITEFSHNVTNWGYCYRKPLGEQKIFNLDRMHMVLLYIRQLGNQAMGTEEFIQSLMKFIDDKISHHKKGQPEDYAYTSISTIQQQHKAAHRMTGVQVTKTNEGWSVLSGLVNHQISIRNLACDCKSKCDICQICCHSFTCSCRPSSVTICQHVHYLAVNNFLTMMAPVAGADEISVVFERNLGVLLEDSSEPSLETDANTTTYIIQSTSDQPSDYEIIELEEKKRTLRLDFEQILYQIKTMRDVRILENLMEPVLPTLIASRLATPVVSPSPSTNNSIT